MAKFTTRVELYGSSDEGVYDSLHNEMAERGFERTISSSNGRIFKLPHAEYTLTGNHTADQVRDLAKQAASLVWRDFGILVTQTDVGRSIYNLRPADD